MLVCTGGHFGSKQAPKRLLCVHGTCTWFRFFIQRNPRWALCSQLFGIRFHGHVPSAEAARLPLSVMAPFTVVGPPVSKSSLPISVTLGPPVAKASITKLAPVKKRADFDQDKLKLWEKDRDTARNAVCITCKETNTMHVYLRALWKW